jgi:hypothetical protein
MKLFFSLLLIFFSARSQAWMIDLDTDFATDAFTTAQEQKNSRTFFQLGMLGDINKGDSVSSYVGWGVISAAAKDTNEKAGVDQTFSTMDTGPLFRFGFGSRGVYSVSLMYSLVAKGKLDQNGTSGDLTGSSYLFKFAIEPEVAEKIYVGFAMNYYAASYSKSVTSSVESDVSYKIQRTFPSISFSYRF